MKHGYREGFPGGSVGKDSACIAGDARDVGLIPGSRIGKFSEKHALKT